MRTVILDGRRMENREIFHEIIARELNFPGWYGKNLDALYDCLVDLREETVISVLYPRTMEERLGDDWKKLLSALLDAQRENGCLRICLQTEN